MLGRRVSERLHSSPERTIRGKGDLGGNRLLMIRYLQRPYVFSLPALGTLGHVELHGLALLQALETCRLDCREMNKNVFATLTANEAEAFGVVEPLHCSLFCHVATGVPFNRFTLERLGSTNGRLPACWARSAHDRFGLTH